MTVITTRKWNCVEINVKEEDGRNSATFFLHGEGIEVKDVIQVLEKAFPSADRGTPTVLAPKRRGKRQSKAAVKAG